MMILPPRDQKTNSSTLVFRDLQCPGKGITSPSIASRQQIGYAGKKKDSPTGAIVGTQRGRVVAQKGKWTSKLVDWLPLHGYLVNLDLYTTLTS